MNWEWLVPVCILMNKTYSCLYDTILDDEVHLLWCVSSVCPKPHLGWRDSKQIRWLFSDELLDLTHWVATTMQCLATMKSAQQTIRLKLTNLSLFDRSIHAFFAAKKVDRAIHLSGQTIIFHLIAGSFRYVLRFGAQSEGRNGLLRKNRVQAVHLT